MTIRSTAHGEAIPDALLEAAAEWVARIHDPDASEADFVEWEEWLMCDVTHRAAYAAMEDVWDLAGRIEPPWATGEELAAQARAKADRLQESTRRRRSFFRMVPLISAAAAIAILVIGIRFAVDKPTVLETTTAEERSLLLPDGSRVTLAAETRLIVEHRRDRRGLKLEHGEAYFEVAHDSSRPFVVRVGDHEAVAVGTAFDVNSNDDRTTVTVTEGVVQLRTVEDDSVGTRTPPRPGSSIQLRIGERAAVDRYGTQQLQRITSPEEALAWRHGRFEYLHEPLLLVIQDINRYTYRKIEIADSTIGNLQFTGTVFVDQLDGWLAALQSTFPLQVVDRGPYRVLQPSGNLTEAQPGSSVIPSAAERAF